MERLIVPQQSRQQINITVPEALHPRIIAAFGKAFEEDRQLDETDEVLTERKLAEFAVGVLKTIEGREAAEQATEALYADIDNLFGDIAEEVTDALNDDLNEAQRS